MTHGIRTLWIALLAVLTAPITAPILLVCFIGICVILAILVLAVIIIFTVGSSMIAFIPRMLYSTLLFGNISISSVLMSVGITCVTVGIGILVVLGIYCGVKAIILYSSKKIGKRMEERVTNHEN